MRSNQTSQFRHLKTKGPLFADSSAALLATSQVEPLELGAAGSIPARWTASTQAARAPSVRSRECRIRNRSWRQDRQAGRGPGSRPPRRVWGPAVLPRAGAHSGAGCGHSRASPTLTERPQSTRRGRGLSLPPSQVACGQCYHSATRRVRGSERFGNLPKVTALESGGAGIRSQVCLPPSPALGEAGTPCAARPRRRRL